MVLILKLGASLSSASIIKGSWQWYMNEIFVLVRAVALPALMTLVALGAYGQNLTGSLRGTARLADGSATPGVLVTASSPSLQGTRTTVTTESGQYLLRNLTPGPYTLTFELEGMATVQSNATVELGQETPVNATMQNSAEEEKIIVTGELSSTLASTCEPSNTYNFEEVNNLPIGRDPDDIASLAPGLTQNTPNSGQITISGGFAYDNVWLIDGVDANDNLVGTINPVYIEDAIADMQVLTSGISAEYGRFTGGVINVITKSGGNEFSGTLRADLENDDWREQTPREEERDIELVDDIFEAYSATLGGYVLKDKLWFFTAGRYEESSSQSTFFRTALPQTNTTSEERLEVKGTANIADKHQVQATFTDREQTGTRPSLSFSVTPDTFRTRTDPSDLKVARYSGVLTPSLFAELQYSEKTFTFMNTHGIGAPNKPLNADGTVNADFLANSPFFDFFTSFSGHYNAPYFDGSDPEDRNNEQLAASLSYFLDSASAGSHDVKFGFEDFTSIRTGGNSQTPTDFVMSAAVLLSNGNVNDPVIVNGDVVPVWTPGASGAWRWLANRNARIETQTQSLYVNDHWQLNDNWSFNVGFRYEEVNGESQAGTVTVDTDAFVPRLAVSYDVRGDGKYRFELTYAQYAGKYSESQFAANTDAGTPQGFLHIFVGEPGVGYDYAPAYDFDNLLGTHYVIAMACDGTQNVLLDDDINSPVVDEITLSSDMELKRGGFLETIYTYREYSDFVEDFITTETGTTGVLLEGAPVGTFSNRSVTNSDLPVREYEAVQILGRYRLSDSWTVDGNYTLQLKNDGNFEGESTGRTDLSSVIGDYPEIRTPSSSFPVGRLNGFQEHKLRAWTNYYLGLGRAGSLNLGFLANWDSGRVLSRVSTFPITAAQREILDSLYVDGPTSQTVYYGTRGDVEFDDSYTFDVAINYQLPISGDFDLWIKADITNIFGDDTQTSGSTVVSPCFSESHELYAGGCVGPVDALGLPQTFEESESFRTDSSSASFVAPREYKLTIGFRF